MTSEELIERMHGLVRQGQDDAAINLLKKYKISKFVNIPEETKLELAFNPRERNIPEVRFEGAIEDCINYVRYKMENNNFYFVENAEKFLKKCVKCGRIKKL
jgi:hypothetical protein